MAPWLVSNQSNIDPVQHDRLITMILTTTQHHNDMIIYYHVKRAVQGERQRAQLG
jgi:hypothetical protein